MRFIGKMPRISSGAEDLPFQFELKLAMFEDSSGVI